MAKEFKRIDRVADHIQRLLAQLLLLETKELGIGFVTVSHVTLTRDYSSARVYVTFLMDEEDDAILIKNLKLLNAAAGKLRMKLAQQANLRTTPALRFYYDETLERAHRINKVLAAIDNKTGEGESH